MYLPHRPIPRQAGCSISGIDESDQLLPRLGRRLSDSLFETQLPLLINFTADGPTPASLGPAQLHGVQFQRRHTARFEFIHRTHCICVV